MTTLTTAWHLLVVQAALSPRRMVVSFVFTVMFWSMPLTIDPLLVLLLLLLGTAGPLLTGVSLARFAARLGDPIGVQIASGFLGAAVGGLLTLVLVGGRLLLAWPPGSSPLERVMKALVPAADPTLSGIALFLLVVAVVGGRKSGAAPLLLIGAALAVLCAFLLPHLGVSSA
jgi:hypothetical protein